MNVNPAHPRLCYTPDRLARWQRYATQNTSRWQRVKKAADAALAGSPTLNQCLGNLAVVYRVTGDPRYGQRAASLLANNLPSPATVQQDAGGYGYRFWLPLVAHALDWCHDQLAPGQAVSLAAWLMDRADWTLGPLPVYCYLPYGNYHTGLLLACWTAALAASGDDPRAQAHLDRCRNVLYPQWAAFASGWGQGGVMPEGSNYGVDQVWFLAEAVLAHLTATGENLFLDHPFLFDSLRAAIHMRSPDGKICYPLGDQARDSRSPEFDYNELAVSCVYGEADPALAGEAQTWLGGEPAPTQSSFYGLAFITARENADVAPADYAALEPPWYTAPNVLFLRRSGWQDPNATWIGVQRGPLFSGHQTRACGGVGVWKGGWLVAPSEVWSYGGNVQPSQFNNVPCFPSPAAVADYSAGYFGQYNTANRVPGMPDSGGLPLWAEHQPGYSVVADQLWPAYVYQRSGAHKPIVSDCRRVTVYLASADAIVVLDRIATTDPAQPRLIPWQAKKPWTINGASYSVDNGVCALAGQALGTAPASLSNRPVMQGQNGTLSSYALDVLYPAAPGPAWYAQAWQLLPLGGTPRPASVSFTATAAIVRVGPTVAVLPLTDLPLVGPLEVPGPMNELVITTLDPSKPWNYRTDGGPWQPLPMTPAGGVDLNQLAIVNKLELTNQLPSVNRSDAATLAAAWKIDVAVIQAVVIPGQPNWPDPKAALDAVEAYLLGQGAVTA